MLQAYIAWQPNIGAIIQKDGKKKNDDDKKDAPAPAPAPPMTPAQAAAAWLAQPAAMKTQADKMFPKIDQDGSGFIDKAEAAAAFQSLVDQRIIPAMPTEEQAAALEAQAGDKIDKDEFLEVFKAVLTAVAA